MDGSDELWDKILESLVVGRGGVGSGSFGFEVDAANVAVAPDDAVATDAAKTPDAALGLVLAAKISGPGLSHDRNDLQFFLSQTFSE